jgi:hypothetical protein
MTDTNWTKSANAFAKELKDLMKKHGVVNLCGQSWQGANSIGIGFAAGERNGETFTMNYRIGNIYKLHAAEVSELSNTFNEL